MSDKIFKSSFLTSMIVLVISFFMIFNILTDFFENQVFSELESEAEYISHGIKNNDMGFIDVFSNQNNGKRITVISTDGKVLADTEAEAEALENHMDRKEVRDAIKDGSGKSSRYSDTLTEKTLYFAKKLDDGSVLRVSTTQNSVVVILLGLMQPAIWVIVIAMAISLFLAYRVANAIIKPINELDLEKPEENSTYDELTPLLQKLAIQKKTIAEHIKQAEKSREEFRLICENMKEGFLVVDKSAKVLSYNSAVLRLLDIDSETDVKDKNVLSVNRSRSFREVTEAAIGGSRGEDTIITDENTYNLIANPVRRDGEVIGAVIVIIDTTESAKREQLRREFTSNVSHELKTPLTSISGFAEILKGGGVPDETVTDFSKSIYDEAQRLISLVSDIMKISELDEGVVPAEKERVDIYELSVEVAERLKGVADRANVAVCLEGRQAYVRGVKKILDEMIYNLCDNGIKYNHRGGRVDISVCEESGKVYLSVSDTGIGIPQNEIPRIFERFYRVEKSRLKSAGGTGLGLAIVKHGAIYHNAKIDVESTEGEGTKITLEFNGD